MEMQQIILFGIALVLVAILLPIIARSLRRVATSFRGRVLLEILSDKASSGERLIGRLTFTSKQEIRGLLKVSLVGQERRQRSVSSSKSDTVDVYRVNQILEETRDFPAGFTRTYDFELVVPTATEARPENEILDELGDFADRQGSKLMGAFLKLAAAKNKRSLGRIFWSIESRLDAEGIDLFEKKRVQVNLLD